MTPLSPLANQVAFHIGPVGVTRTVVTTWGLMALLSLSSWMITRRLPRGAAELNQSSNRVQIVLEVLIGGMLSQIQDVTRRDARPMLPLLGTLFIFLLAANLIGLLPGLQAPTAKLETPAALALIVFGAAHVFGVRARGLRGYLASFAQPKWFMLPLNLLSGITRTLSLTVRLFGNIMSGEFLIGLVVALAGLFVPVPLMALELLVGIIQAYIFSVLATVFIGAATSGE